MATVVDPWALAANAKAPERRYWGQVFISTRLVGLEKGKRGGVDYNPEKHKRAFSQITISVIPLPEMDLNWNVDRVHLNIDKEWYAITKPSILEAEGGPKDPSELRTINKKFARVLLVPTGETYPKRDEEGNVVREVELTAFKFERFFDTRDEARVDFLLGEAEGETTPAQNGNGDQSAENGLLPFLKFIVDNAARDQSNRQVVIQSALASLSAYPPVAAEYDPNSPDTVAIIEKLLDEKNGD